MPLLAGGAPREDPAVGQPSRETARYALTSTFQADVHDPTAWRLLASNDGGQTWTNLDTRTNEVFTGRGQRRIFYIRNRRPYNMYRLQIDAVNSAGPSVDMSVQLADFALIGPLFNAPNESKLEPIISCSCANPVVGPPEYAFDDDATTVWCDYGLGSPGGCWIQIRYATNSAVPVTNLWQAGQLMHLSAAHAALADGGARALTNLTGLIVPPRQLNAYALTSANDEPERDPRDWRLLGSDDGGKTWTTMDARSNQIFGERFERRVFYLTNAEPRRLYRLEITACADTNSDCQVAEVEPIYGDPQNDAKYSLVVEANSENPPLESTQMAFDNDSRTKWLSFNVPSSDGPSWLQWQFIPREEDLPVINQRQLDRVARELLTTELLQDTNVLTLSINGYALTSANDFPARDPSDWRLLGSSDGGKTWQTLDTRRRESFTGRHQRRVFSLAQPVSRQMFRFQVDSVATPTNANSCQLAELELLLDHATKSTMTVLAAAEGENAPQETVDNLFDGDVNTKWLDYAPSLTNRSSWIEWHYVPGPAHAAIDLDREMATESLSPKRFKARLSAAVLFADPAAGLAGLGDASGFQWVHLDPWPAALATGRQIDLRGDLQVRAGAILVSKARLESSEALPAAPEELAQVSALSGQRFVAGVVTGRVAGIFCGSAYCGATLTLSNGSSLIVRLPGARFPVAPDSAALVRVQGVIEYMLASGNKIVPGVVWASNARAITQVAAEAWAEDGSTPQENWSQTSNAPASLLTRIADVRQYLSRGWTNDAPFRVHGVITYIDLNLGEFYLQEGPESLEVVGQMNAGLAPKLSEEGSYVELQGVVHGGAVYATSFARALGKGRMPQPLRPAWDDLIAGEDDNRWVEIEGVITAAERQRITLSVAGGQMIVWINELERRSAPSLPGSVARIRGVCSPVVNARNQRLGVRLLVPSFECVDLVSLAPKNPFDLALVPMSDVLRANPDEAVQPKHSIKTKGTITCRQGRMLFLQEGADGMRVTLRSDANVEPGDLVEAVGMPQPDGFSPKLIQAVVRRVGDGILPKAAPIDLAEMAAADSAEERDATVGTIEATVLSDIVDASHWTLNLRDEKSHLVFSACLPAGDWAKRDSIPIGSRVRLQGVFKAIRDKTPDIDQAATSFEMYLNSARDITMLERPSWWTSTHTLRLAIVFIGVLCVALAWIWLLRNQVRQRTRALALKIQEHQRSEALLADEVAERKRLQADAEKAHKELLIVARQAGMAEVATGILHNVGNVLNSVSVSSSLMIDRLRRSRLKGLENAVVLLRQHETELGPFFMNDEKGKKLLPYLEQLAAYLTADQAGSLKELEGLDKNIEHIKDIVTVQQNSAKFAGLTEPLQVIELVEDAIRMNASSLERHEVQVVRELESNTPMVFADRHKVLQILVNLIRNAKQACDESGKAEKLIRIRAANGDGKVKVSVSDNGVGIAPDNMNRVFNHGFTTRKDGHGFGLHNAALSAKEMGGALRVSSEGPGAGATFTLELPVAQKIGASNVAAAA